MDSTKVLAFDLGASNGRAIVAEYKNETIKLHEVHRFTNNPVELNNYIYWDFPRLFYELKTALIKAKNSGHEIKSMGVDSWGVDYGLINEEGELACNPIHYRDKRAAKGLERLLNQYDTIELKKRTGMDCVSYNTINQLMMDTHISRSKRTNERLNLLNIPDLFNYFLTGKQTSEFSMVTTSQLYDYSSQQWNYKLMEELNIPMTIFNPVMPSGRIIGDVKTSIVEELKIQPLKVVSVTSHDTAAAIRAIPTDEEDFLFIATGTWIIVGSKQKEMTMNEQVMEYDLTNEGGKFPFINLLKNHVGLWMLQESKCYWINEGIDIGFSEMVQLGEEAMIESFIDIMDPRFFEPGNMPLKVEQYCEETHQQKPKSIGETVKIIEQSLAKQIASTLFQIEEAVGKSYNKVHIIGGGTQDRLLCSLIEKYSNKTLVIGPKEATTLGNVVDQFIALDIFSEEQRLDVLKNSI